MNLTVKMPGKTISDRIHRIKNRINRILKF